MMRQDVKNRVKKFDEVALGLSEKEALTEAKRCLNCKKAACIAGCPVEINIPAFIRLIKEKRYDEAITKIKEKNNLPAICGRVCPQEDQCEKACILMKKGKAIKIGYLERFAADWGMKSKQSTGHNAQYKKHEKEKVKIAVIGSGPAGLTASADLAKMGYAVTLFESLHKTGGVLVYGIPEFRMPKKIVEYEVGLIRNLGVEIELNVVIGKTVTLDRLREEGFQAFFISTGAGLPYFLNIEGENLNGVYSANEFLTRTNLMKAYLFPEYDTPITVGERVGVIGGGNVAMDSARSALRLGAKEVTIIYRRTEQEMPARIEEIENAKEEGIKLHLLTSPIKILGNGGSIEGIECVQNKLGEPDESGRRRPVAIEGSQFKIELNTLICAIGQGPNPLLLDTLPSLDLNKRGNISAGDDGATSMNGVFAGGDIVTGSATVISAMGAGKRAARAIDKHIKGHART